MKAYYPVCLDLANKKCVVVGGGEVAERKVVALLAAKARVVVVSPDLTAGLRQLGDQGGVEHWERRYQPGDLAEAFLAVAATGCQATNHTVAAEARQRHILVNAVDDVDHSDFITPAVMRRGGLSIAVSTDGQSPAMASYVCDELKHMITSDHETLLALAAEERAALQPSGRHVAGETWRRALDQTLRTLLRDGDIDRARAELSARLAVPGESTSGAARANVEGETEEARRVTGTSDLTAGMVSLVGAGPGDPGLITARGLGRLRAADVVIYDRLVDDRLLGYVRQDAEVIYVGKMARRHSLRQTAINALLISKARAGHRVVRLKGGDPFVFGRGAEEAEELAAAAIPFEIVPGVSSAIAAPAYAGIPLTHRRCASSFAVITGHENADKPESRIAWDKLATAVDTIVCLMGAQSLRQVVDRLIEHGRPAETPVALIRWGTWLNQQTITGRLDNIVQLAAEQGFGSPAVAVIGEVVRLRDSIRWFETTSTALGQRQREQIMMPPPSLVLQPSLITNRKLKRRRPLHTKAARGFRGQRATRRDVT